MDENNKNGGRGCLIALAIVLGVLLILFGTCFGIRF